MKLATLTQRLGNLADASLQRKRLVVEAGVLLAALKTTIAVVPYHHWRHLVEVTPESDTGPLSREQIADVIWAVDRVSRLSPRLLNCLPQALAAQRLLKRRGCTAALRIGVSLDDAAGIEAHAWLEIGGEVVIGGVPNLARFKRLQRWPEGAVSD